MTSPGRLSSYELAVLDQLEAELRRGSPEPARHRLVSTALLFVATVALVTGWVTYWVLMLRAAWPGAIRSLR